MDINIGTLREIGKQFNEEVNTQISNRYNIKKLLPVLLTALLTHGIGVYFGSKNASRINQKLLKTGVAVFSVGIAVCKLTGIF